MKLYYSPGACSLASHIMLREAGKDFELERVDLRAHRTEGGGDYMAVNPKGYVPALKLDNGELLTENLTVLQYVTDQSEALKIDGAQRYRLLEWMTFIATEIHKTAGALFRPNTPEEYKTISVGNIKRRLETVAQGLDGRAYLLGDRFSAADAYLFAVLSWMPNFGIDLAQWPAITAFMQRMKERPTVREAMQVEGLTKTAAHLFSGSAALPVCLRTT